MLFLDGKFGAYMSVDITNDGPVTISLDSQNKVIEIIAYCLNILFHGTFHWKIQL